MESLRNSVQNQWKLVWRALGQFPNGILKEFLSLTMEIGPERIGASGSFWELLGASGGLWESLGASGSLWEPLGASGSLWELLVDSGSLWEPLVASGSLWGVRKNAKKAKKAKKLCFTMKKGKKT